VTSRLGFQPTSKKRQRPAPLPGNCPRGLEREAGGHRLRAYGRRPKGEGWKGIYALDGDTLSMCDNAPNLDEGRPTAFEAKSGSGHVRITFKRAKP